MDVNSQANFKIICQSLEFSTIAEHATTLSPKLSTATELNREMVATRTSKSAANAYANLIQVIADEYIEHKYIITDLYERSTI